MSLNMADSEEIQPDDWGAGMDDDTNVLSPGCSISNISDLCNYNVSNFEILSPSQKSEIVVRY